MSKPAAVAFVGGLPQQRAGLRQTLLGGRIRRLAIPLAAIAVLAAGGLLLMPGHAHQLTVLDGDNLVMLGSGTGGPTTVGQNVSSFAWAPDGSRLAWISSSNRLYLWNNDAVMIGTASGTPTWSQDGNWIASFTGSAAYYADLNNRSISKQNASYSQAWAGAGSLFLVNSTSANDGQVILVDAKSRATQKLSKGWADGWVGNTNSYVLVEVSGGSGETISVASVDGTSQVVVVPPDGGWSNIQSLVVSPDGKKLAVVSAGSLYVSQIGLNQSPLEIAQATGWAVWSPNGQWLAFAGQQSVEMIRADGTGDTVLQDSSNSSHATWSPDSGSLAWVSTSGEVTVSHTDSTSSLGVYALNSSSATLSWRP